ncbi:MULTISPECIES: lytic transglycosylase domain-containing protein [unclassified Haematospirillum]|uniref:lytic transglycosylase domain-containing protein n=1 Tax=unclassified Haematospirillum TaxID=2622088 RepID=UPI00143977D2|nr:MULTISPECIES: lytic transglycosylase domain-containing protein [unclassified Haematospirillum]NKD55802.1 lytic transglycosylase domain-containing protein [Haematospirillum sp. H4890]NKD75887.1 lytic transglycosylase domain-containing protein [Haematospirillum sp. H4485]
MIQPIWCAGCGVAVLLRQCAGGIVLSLLCLLFSGLPACAFSSPDPGDDGARHVGISSVLSAPDVERYQRIFSLQDQGLFAAADHVVRSLDSKLLLGYVLQDRYLSARYGKASFQELRSWMELYADHHDARRIYRLARKRGGGALPHPVSPEGLVAGISGDDPRWEREASVLSSRAASVLKTGRIFRGHLVAGRFDAASNLLRTSPLSSVDRDRLWASLAYAAFIKGKDETALRFARQVRGRDSRALSLAHWAGGLASWRRHDYEEAAVWFSALRDADNASPWVRSAAAYWSARSALKNRRPQEVSQSLHIAASYPHTFYGLIARRALGLPLDFSWRTDTITEQEAVAITDTPAGRRALALVLVGKHDRAEDELRRLYPAASHEQRQAILHFAEREGMASLALHLSSVRTQSMDNSFESARYPVPAWQPRNGWALDRAMLYAFARQESAFNPAARSPAGAVGLMQIMPATARAVARMENNGWLGGSRAVMDPEVSLSLGQSYLEHLLGLPDIKGNMFFVAAAYNAGPGTLARWRKTVRYDDDPLLFIEAIPSRETRAYIERVLADLWIYRDRLGQDNPGLDMVASGRWPLYVPQDARTAPATSQDQSLSFRSGYVFPPAMIVRVM